MPGRVEAMAAEVVMQVVVTMVMGAWWPALLNANLIARKCQELPDCDHITGELRSGTKVN